MSPSKPSARTQATRARLIASAEQLFAHRGIDSVSLNEITRAAEQKNRNAVHYHFGSKDALLQAIFEKHWQPIGVMRRDMLAALEQQKDIGLRDIAALLVRPVAARFEDDDGGIAYIHISAQLAPTNALQYEGDSIDPAQDANYGPTLSKLWQPFLAPLPGKVRAQRLSLIVGMLFHGLADHAKTRQHTAADTQLMVSNLIDSICAVVQAPVSDDTRAVTTPL